MYHMYIKNIIFPKINEHRRDYPANIIYELGRNDFPLIKPVTLIYGSNGSGKSTLLNIIAHKLQCKREIHAETKPIFDHEDGKLVFLLDEIARKTIIRKESSYGWPQNRRMITSAEVLDHISLKNDHNNWVYNDIKNEIDRMDRWEWEDNDGEISEGSLYLKKISERDQYYRMSMKGKSVFSNGEEMLDYFFELMEPNSIYLLDEPENCLSTVYQKKLADYILDLANNHNCQFLIASHSPFFLSIQDAHIIDIDQSPATDCNNWAELENMQPYFELFTNR